MSAYLVVTLSVFASATATLTLNLLARLDWRRVRAWTRPAVEDAPAEPGQLLEARQGACGCLTIAGAVALLHEQGYLPVGQLGSGGELLANGEAAAIWPAPPDRIAAVQFGTLTLGPAHQQPATHLDATALLAASRSHRTTLTNRPAPDPATQPGCSSRSTRWVTRRRHSMPGGPPRRRRPPQPGTPIPPSGRRSASRAGLGSITVFRNICSTGAPHPGRRHRGNQPHAAGAPPLPEAYGRVPGGYLSRRRPRAKGV